MNKIIASLVLMGSVCAFAATDDTTVVAGSKGVDRYVDGTQVLVGECYALVWSQNEFAGFNADGTLVNPEDKVLVILSRADKNGACPLFGYDVPRALIQKGGTITLWLLDTRTFGDDGTVKTFVVKDWSTTSVPSVAAAGQVDAIIKIEEPGTKHITNVAVDEMIATAVPQDAPVPVIKSIKVENGYAIIQVENTVPFITYDLDAGKDPSALVDGNAEYPVNGATEKTQSITLIKKAKDASQFFKVRRKK